MDFLAGLASKHALLVHLPVAAALLIPVPVIASQRGGRGIRPWWITCRYLAWAGLVGSLFAVLSGLNLPGRPALLPLVAYWNHGHMDLLHWHQATGLVCLALAVACLRALYRRRQAHQGIGIVALLLGVAWCACALASGYSGARLAAPAQAGAQTAR